MTDEKLAHNSHYVYAIIRKRVYKSALPRLGAPQTKGQVIFIILLIFLASFGGTMMGFQVDANYLHKPLTILGVCQAPAVIQGNNCFIIQTSTDSNGKAVITRIPAGIYYWPNGSRYQG